VRVDEPRQEDPPSTVDPLGVRIRTEELLLAPHGRDPLSHDRDGGPGQDAGVAEFFPAAGARRTGAGDDLGGVEKEAGSHRSLRHDGVA